MEKKISPTIYEWIKKAGVRAIKTFAQTMVGCMGVGLAMSEIQWGYALSVSVVALIMSLLTSTAGLPELKNANDTVGDIVLDPENENAYIAFDGSKIDGMKEGDQVSLNVVGSDEGNES